MLNARVHRAAPALPSPDVRQIPEVSGTVRAVCVGRKGTLQAGGRRIATAFVKTPVDGPVPVTTLGLPGDEHVYREHGGAEMALLAYAHEHYARWRALGIALPEAGAMGENLTLTGMVETDVHVGDTFAVGPTVVVQVTQPRSPCSKIAARYGRPDLAVQVQEAGATGWLLRVLTEGSVAAGDRVVLVDREPHGVTVAEAGRVLHLDRENRENRDDRDDVRRVLAVASLGVVTRRKLEARLA